MNMNGVNISDEHERCEYLWYRPREMTTDRAKRICSQIQKGRGIFADARPYYVVVSRRCHSTRYQFQLTTEGEHQKRILLDENIKKGFFSMGTYVS